MNILRIIPSLDPCGGGPMEGARRVDAQLIRSNHSIEVVCLDFPGQHFLNNYPALVHALGSAKFGYRYCPELIPWLRENHKRFDAVIIDGLWQYHGYAAWRTLSNSQTPYFVFTHGMLDPWFKRTYPLKHLKKLIYWTLIECKLIRDARAILFTCDKEKQLANESFQILNSNEAVISLGTDLPPQDKYGILANNFRNSHIELRNKRILLFLSRIHEKKGCDLLVWAFAEAARDNPDLHLVMAGPDQTGLVPKLKLQAQALGIADRITWPGMLQGDQKWGAFHAAEAFCLPSHQENFGIVLAEALGCGKPVLTSDKVNIWREISADCAGIIQPDTLEGTKRALSKWLELSPDDQDRMAKAARACFDERYRIEQVAQNLVTKVKSYILQSPDIIKKPSQ